MPRLERPHAMVGDIGRPIAVSCKGFDLTDVDDAVVTFDVEKPSGARTTWEDATLDVDAKEITRLSEAGELDEGGIWKVQGQLTKTDGSFQQTDWVEVRVGFG